MPNKTINDDNVKWYPKNKYSCKRNKGEHQWSEPVLKDEPSIRYLYKTDINTFLNSSEFHPEYKLIRTEMCITAETRCIHCGKKYVSFLSDKII